MSYILDALKRLEQEKAAVRKGRDPLESLREPDGVPKRARAWKRVIGFGVILLAALAAAVTVTYRIANRKAPVLSSNQEERSRPGSSLEPSALPSGRGVQGLSPPASGKEEQQGGIPGSDRLVRSRSLPPVPAPGSPEYSARGVISRAPESYPAAVAPLESEEAAEELLPTDQEPEELLEAKKGSPESRQDGEIVEDEESGQPRETPLKSSLPETNPEAEAEEPYSPDRVYPNGGKEGLKISAIVWSPDKKARFAMINLKTVYEGDSIDGKGIVAIQEDGVVFMEGNQQYKVTLSTR